MPTIDDILNRIGVTSNSTADSQMEKEAQALGLIDNEPNKLEGDRMNLKNFYDNHFDGGLEKEASAPRAQAFTKRASVNQERLGELAGEAFERNLSNRLGTSMSKTASYQYNMGAVARDTFDYLLQDRLNRFSLIKQAMEDVGSPESAATQAAGSGASVIPSGLKGSPLLDVNRPSNADDKIDTSPEYYDLGPEMDSAIEKARLEKALAEGAPDNDERGTHNMASGMEMPDSQATA